MKRTGKLGPVIAALLFGAMAATSLAAGKLGPMTPMTGLHSAEFVDYYSAAIDERFRIFVASPTFVEPGKKYPVIYVLDANGMFGSVMEMVRLLAFMGETPNAFVVGIGYAVDHGLAGALSKRYRDLSPTKGGPLEDMTRQWAAGAEPVMPGGGPAFLQFLREEIKPAIEAAYAVDPADATIGGASLAGLFVAWTLLTEPESFQRYIVTSPSIWWNQEEVWQWEEATAARTRNIDATVFVTAGGLETVDLLKAQVGGVARQSSPGDAGAGGSGGVRRLRAVWVAPHGVDHARVRCEAEVAELPEPHDRRAQHAARDPHVRRARRLVTRAALRVWALGALKAS